MTEGIVYAPNVVGYRHRTASIRVGFHEIRERTSDFIVERSKTDSHIISHIINTGGCRLYHSLTYTVNLKRIHTLSYYNISTIIIHTARKS